MRVSAFHELANVEVVYTPRFDADRFIDGSRLSYFNPALGRIAGRDAIIDPLTPDASFFDALATVGSDHEHGKVLTAVMRRAEMTPELARRVLESSLAIGSDHEQAQVLVQLASTATLGDDLRPLFQQALDNIGSEHERERVQEALWY